MSEFSELIKHLHRVRGYVRGFYLSSWRGRGDYDDRSPRTYDNERRRVESLFNEYVRRHRINDGAASRNEKTVSLEINATNIVRNPLYEVWRAKSFTPSDIMLHFTILDAGARNLDGFTMNHIAKRVVDMTSAEGFLWNKENDIPSDSTIRDKLNEYVEAGLLIAEKNGKEKKYFPAPLTCAELPEDLKAATDFFSEAAPFGELGDHIRDEGGWSNEFFRFKHHFIAHTLDDEILYDLLTAIKERKRVTLTMEKGPGAGEASIPCKILVSVQSGRRYIGMVDGTSGESVARRLDYIDKVETGGEICEAEYSKMLQKFEANLGKAWGVSFGMGMNPKPSQPEKVVMTLHIDEKSEKYVLDKLKREERRGKVERVKENVFSFTHEVWDSNEMLPFIMNFLGRVISLECKESTQNRFQLELASMIKMYGVGE